MGKLSGGVLIIAGVAVAAYALASQPPAPRQGSGPAEVIRAGNTEDGKPGTMPVTAAPAATAVIANGPPGAASAASRSDNPVRLAQSSPPSPATDRPPIPAMVPATLAPPSPVPAQRLRSAPGSAVSVAEAPRRIPVGEAKSPLSPALDGPALTREIQRHLKRVGCYEGEVTGVWTPSVRQAMRAFNERINASLPVKQADPVLLAVVQNAEAGTCSAGCPAGQERAGNGRCLPTALVTAAATRAAKARGTAAPAPARVAAPHVPAKNAPVGQPTAAYRPPMDGRMALSGPAASAAPQVAPRPVMPRPKAMRQTRAREATRTRTAQGRVRERRAAQRPAYSGFSGLPSWALPFMMP